MAGSSPRAGDGAMAQSKAASSNEAKIRMSITSMDGQRGHQRRHHQPEAGAEHVAEQGQQDADRHQRPCITRGQDRRGGDAPDVGQDRKSTRLNSSHMSISYAVFCLKKKKRNS